VRIEALGKTLANAGGKFSSSVDANGKTVVQFALDTSRNRRHVKKVGSSAPAIPDSQPSVGALRAAASQQAVGSALAAFPTTGIRKGIYRFKSHAEMNRHTEEALAHAVALNASRRPARR
jgi:hypothetical protein